MFLRRRTPLSRSYVSSMTRVGDGTLLSRNHVSIMTGGCTYPMYYQTVVSGEKGSAIIRDKKNKLADQKKVRNPPCQGHVSSMTWAGSRTMLSRSHVSSMTG